MSGEIKFRGKRLDTGDWVYGFCVAMAGIPQICTFTSDNPNGATCYDIDPKSVGQYVGCEDTQGREIYEGDIIQRDGCEEVVAEVRYVSGYSGYYGEGHYRISGAIGWMLKQGYRIKVIGNVVDTPELLNELQDKLKQI